MMQKVSHQIFLVVLLVLVGTSYIIQAAPSQLQKSNGFLTHLINKRETCGGNRFPCGHGRADCCPGLKCYYLPPGFGGHFPPPTCL